MHYLYDGAQVIQQTLKTANGEALQSTEYIYEPGSFRPAAQVDTNHTRYRKLHYVVTDHAGTPRELCVEDGDIVWRGEQSLWHRYTQILQSNVKRLFEDTANDPVHCDLRYQGQLEDKDSGLYYNLNRYYDADSGQYLSSDPIGMLGGLRLQAYVHNPMEWIDPLGLTGHSHGNSKEYKLYDNLVNANPHLKKEIIEEYDNIKLGNGTPRVYTEQDCLRNSIPDNLNVGDQKILEDRSGIPKKWVGAYEWDVPNTNHRIVEKNGVMGYVTNHVYKTIRTFPKPWFSDGGKPTKGK